MRSNQRDLGLFVVVQALGLGAVLPTARADLPSGTLVQNGSFEQPVVSGDFQSYATIPGWSPTSQCQSGGDIDVVTQSLYTPADGNQFVELNASCVNGISQFIPTIPGTPAYSLTLAFGARPGTTAQQNQMSVTFDGQVVDNLVQTPGDSNLGWSLHQYNVTATSPKVSQLILQGTDPNAGDVAGTEVDFVSLVPLVVDASPFQVVPGTGNAFGNGIMNVTCPTSDVCIASSLYTLTVITDGVPGPTQQLSTFSLTSVSCTSATSCIGMGTDNETYQGVVVPITNGVVGAPQIVPGTSGLGGLTCVSPTSCFSLGSYFGDSGPNGVVVPFVDGVPGPAQTVPGVEFFDGLACASPTSCIALGENDVGQGLVIPINDGVPGTPQPVDGIDYFTGIACPSAGSCVAVGDPPGAASGDPGAAIGAFVTITGGMPGPVQLVPGAAYFNAVACTDPSHCVATGQSGYSYETSTDGVVVAIDNGVAGPVQVVPGSGYLAQVACATSCVALGGTYPFGNSVFGAIVPIAGGVAGSVQYASGGGPLDGNVCNASGCIVVGADTTGTQGGFLTITPTSTPTLSTTASPSAPQGGTLSDSALVTGGGSSTPTGTVTFTLYGPGDDTCSTPLSTSTMPLGADGTASSGDVQAGPAGTYNWVASYSGDLANFPTSSACGAEPVVITPRTLTGRAYGVSADARLLGLSLLDVAPTPDTGDVVTTSSSATSVPCVATLSGLLRASALCASVTTTGYPGSSTAAASVSDASLSIATLPVVEIGAVNSTSTTSCGGSTGTTTIGYLKVGSIVVIDAQTTVAPNTHVTVGAVDLVLNEQIPLSGSDTGLTVNAIHLTVDALGLARTDLVVGSAQSDIDNCP